MCPRYALGDGSDLPGCRHIHPRPDHQRDRGEEGIRGHGRLFISRQQHLRRHRWVWQFFTCTVSVPVHIDSVFSEMFNNSRIFPGNFAAFLHSKFGGFSIVFLSYILYFSLILKEFNIGQKIMWLDRDLLCSLTGPWRVVLFYWTRNWCAFWLDLEILCFLTGPGNVVLFDWTWKCCAFLLDLEMLCFLTGPGNVVLFARYFAYY